MFIFSSPSFVFALLFSHHFFSLHLHFYTRDAPARAYQLRRGLHGQPPTGPAANLVLVGLNPASQGLWHHPQQRQSKPHLRPQHKQQLSLPLRLSSLPPQSNTARQRSEPPTSDRTSRYIREVTPASLCSSSSNNCTTTTASLTTDLSFSIAASHRLLSATDCASAWRQTRHSWLQKGNRLCRPRDLDIVETTRTSSMSIIPNFVGPRIDRDDATDGGLDSKTTIPRGVTTTTTIRSWSNEKCSPDCVVVAAVIGEDTAKMVESGVDLAQAKRRLGAGRSTKNTVSSALTLMKREGRQPSLPPMSSCLLGWTHPSTVNRSRPEQFSK
ncbi:unnamed protein product [Protopolystoma xenopodis]|uniref:Uncharacterized protein n=1 Tax=Protopolystoma xenopodis TaxID=117903 RepID=A0A448WZF4_9PLAT|nr:unnamed protein product [Protopolystoma xenopodis]